MKPRDSASTERGSMLPLFIALVALISVMALGLAQASSGYVFRESLQSQADQLALVAATDKLNSADQVSKRLLELSDRLTLKRFSLIDGKTVELQLCGIWSNRSICATAAAR